MSITDIEITTWLLWVAIGIIVGLVAAGFYGGRRMLGYDLFVGVVCSILGGGCSAYIAGDSTKALSIVSILCAAFLSILGVYMLNRYALRRPRRRH